MSADELAQLRAENEELRQKSAYWQERKEQLDLDYVATLNLFARIRDGAEAAEARIAVLQARLDAVIVLAEEHDDHTTFTDILRAAHGHDPRNE